MLVSMANYYPEGWCTPAKWENVQRKPCIFILNPLGVEGTMILSSSVDLEPIELNLYLVTLVTLQRENNETERAFTRAMNPYY